MALRYICDLTGEMVDKDDIVILGYVDKKHYCPEAAEKVRAFLDDFDKLHDDVAAEFRKKVAKLRKEWMTAHGNGRDHKDVLPDQGFDLG